MVSGSRFRVSGFGFMVSGFGFRVSGFGSRFSGSWFRVSGFSSNLCPDGNQRVDGGIRGREVRHLPGPSAEATLGGLVSDF